VRTVGVAALGALVGIVLGLVASELIGIAGYVLAHRAVGVRYLPLYLAALFAVLAPALAVLLRRRR
jgi:hypothetical protein